MISDVVYNLIDMVRPLGKGPGFVALAFAELIVGGVLLAKGVDGVGIAAAFGAINVPVYGGGAMKAVAEARNGSNQ